MRVLGGLKMEKFLFDVEIFHIILFYNIRQLSMAYYSLENLALK